jgi:hypothetical protein
MENLWLNKVHFTSAISSCIEIPPQFEFCFRRAQRYEQHRFHNEERCFGPLLSSHASAAAGRKLTSGVVSEFIPTSYITVRLKLATLLLEMLRVPLFRNTAKCRTSEFVRSLFRCAEETSDTVLQLSSNLSLSPLHDVYRSGLESHLS